MKRLITLIASMSLSLAVSASPSSQSNWLIGEPASLMDLGVYRLENQFERFNVLYGNNVGAARGHIWYKFNDDRIVIRGVIVENGNQKIADNAEARFLCKEVIKTIRVSVGVDYSGKPWNGESSQLILYFSHQGYVNGSEPTDLASHLDNIARLEAIVRYSSDDEKEGLVECQAPLLNGKVMFAE